MRGKALRICLTPDAAKSGVAPLDIKIAAAEAIGSNGISLRPEIYFLRFQAKGRHFALTTRLTIEVDAMPNRTPPRVLRSDRPEGRRR
jgi:hypothetical protein